jgi:hypothetical protein
MECADEMGQYLGDFLPRTHDGHLLRSPGMCDLSQLWARLFANVMVEEDQNLQPTLPLETVACPSVAKMGQQDTDV